MNTILITLLIIALLILVHEWGHFMAARRIGIPVYEFAIGFGPRVLSWKRDGVVYSWRLIPLGGFVRMAGEEPGDPEDPNSFSNRTPLEKIRVSFAGPFMNFVLALLIFVLSYSIIGLPHSSNEAVIGTVMAGKPADLAGIKAGDRIVAVNGVAVNSWADFNQHTSQNSGQALELQLERKQQLLELEVIPAKLDSSGNMGIGVLNQVIYEKQGVIKSMELGLKQTYELTLLLFSALGIIISGGASMGDLAGPVGITHLVGEFAQMGTIFLLNFAAFLSINLGIMNLLPIPALDGSKIIFAIVEAIRKKPLDPEKEGFLNWIGFLFLISLMVIVTFNDILRWIRG